MSRYKTIDRKVNRVARKLNKQLAEDELWRGRFEVRQYQKAPMVAKLDNIIIVSMIRKQENLLQWVGLVSFGFCGLRHFGLLPMMQL